MNHSPATPARTWIAVLVLTVGLTACGSQAVRSPSSSVPEANAKTEAAAAAAVATEQTVRTPVRTPVVNKPITGALEAPRAVHFSTPAAAMRYLAAAYNRGDLAALQKVTTPGARAALADMRSVAPRMQLEECIRDMDGASVCVFRHDYPKGSALHGHGEATVSVAPADKPGWYMAELLSCS